MLELSLCLVHLHPIRLFEIRSVKSSALIDEFTTMKYVAKHQGINRNR